MLSLLKHVPPFLVWVNPSSENKEMKTTETKQRLPKGKQA